MLEWLFQYIVQYKFMFCSEVIHSTVTVGIFIVPAQWLYSISHGSCVIVIIIMVIVVVVIVVVVIVVIMLT